MEGDRTDLGEKLAKQTAMFDMLGQNVERLVEQLSANTTTLTHALEKLDDKLSSNGIRLATLEVRGENSEQWKASVRKILYWALTSGAAATCGFLAERLLKR